LCCWGRRPVHLWLERRQYKNILDFEKEFKDAKVIKLEQNYRSTQIILDAANHVIKNNVGRKAKRLWTNNKGGDGIRYLECLNEHEEAYFVASEIKRLVIKLKVDPGWKVLS